MDNVTSVKKSTAVILALFFSFWTWLYTFKQDGRKLWIVLGILLLLLVPAFYLWNTEPPPPEIQPGKFFFYDPPFGDSYTIGSVSSGVLLVIYYFIIWAFVVIYAISRPVKDYVIADNPEQKHSLLLAVIFGPFSWLYRYRQNAWKFWLSLVILIVSLIIVPRMTHAVTFSTIREISSPGYVDLRFSFSQRLNDFLFNNLWQYSEYYQLKNIRLVSFLVPAVLWAYPVIEGSVRLLRRNKTPV
jgi:hypothetical protein